MSFVKKWISLLAACLLLFMISLPGFAATLYLYDSEIIPYGSMHAVAHRGYSAVAPENTLPAYRFAGEFGFWGAECDISQTADGVWILMHDVTVDRMTDGTGAVADLTYAEIAALTIDAGNCVEDFPGTKVPMLTEYLDVCSQYGLHPVIEIKESVDPENLPDLAAILDARPEKDRFILISWGRDLIAGIETLLPDMPTYLIGGPGTADDVAFCVANGIDGLDFSGNTSADVIRTAQAEGLKTMVWTVDSLALAESFYQLGVIDLTTNALVPGKTQSEEPTTEPTSEPTTEPTSEPASEPAAENPTQPGSEPFGGSSFDFSDLWQRIVSFFRMIGDFFRNLFR